MTDAGFVAAAYGVILGGLALYTITLWRRLRSVEPVATDADREDAAGRGQDDEAR